MNESISLNRFSSIIGHLWANFPNAKVMSIGTEYSNGESHYILWLEIDGKEIRYKIPAWEN